MIFLFYIIGLRAQDTLIYNFDASLNTISPNWLGSTEFTNCSTNQIFGGYSQLSRNTQLFNYQVNIIPHYYIKVEIYLSRLGDWSNGKMCVYIDYDSFDGQCKQYSNSDSIITCNLMQYEEDLIVFGLDHNLRSAQIQINPVFSTSDTIYWGIRQFRLYVKQCQPQCDYCRFQYDACQWRLAITSLVQVSFINFDGWMIQDSTKYEIINLTLYYLYFRQLSIYKIIQLKSHDQIKIRLRKSDGLPVSFQLDSNPTTFNCQDDEINYFNCETDAIIHSSPQINFQILPSTIGQIRGEIRDFEIFIGIDQSQQAVIEIPLLECITQVNKTCIQCQEGWIISPFLKKCQPICGDGLIQGNEECDYGNFVQDNFNCVNCKYKCDQYCISCKFGVCFWCQEGYYLNDQHICKQSSQDHSLQNYQYYQCEEGWLMNPILQQCQPRCGDGFIRGDEECDYGNEIKTYSNCINCKYKCDQNCMSCQFGICSQCDNGFQLNQNKTCEYVINDSILIPYSGEQCDDGNNIKGDGCYEGKYECSQHCDLCNQVICSKCQQGFKLRNGICQSICDDKTVIKDLQECDDGNNLDYTGCFNCQYQCIKSCTTCKDGYCVQKCEEGYEFQQDKCVSICGDFIKTKDEECDDGNTEPFDGCFQCKSSCPLNCKTCLSQICLECEEQWDFHPINERCYPICGD